MSIEQRNFFLEVNKHVLSYCYQCGLSGIYFFKRNFFELSYYHKSNLDSIKWDKYSRRNHFLSWNFAK